MTYLNDDGEPASAEELSKMISDALEMEAALDEGIDWDAVFADCDDP
jgi:hypothetical protein